jgi:hypothetical protein
LAVEGMRWSLAIMLVGVLLIALGSVPLLIGNIDVPTLESAAGFFTVGIFFLLVGFGLRRVRKVLEKSASSSA